MLWHSSTRFAAMSTLEDYCQLVAHQYFAPGLETQDLVQEARIGVWKAQRSFDPSRGDWELFARLAAKRNVITAVRAATRDKHAVLSHAVSYDEPTSNGDDTLADRLPAPTDIAREYEQRERVRGLFGKLSGLEADVVRHRLAGDALQVDGKAIDNALQRARRKAQATLDSYDQLAA